MLQRITQSFRNRIIKGAAIAAAATIGFGAMTDTAEARGAEKGERSVTLQLAHGQHGYRPFKSRCVAKAIRRNGRVLRGTRGVGVRKFERRACRVALRRCRANLNRKRHNTGRAFPYARCEVTRVRRVGNGNGHYHNHGHNNWGGIVLKF